VDLGFAGESVSHAKQTRGANSKCGGDSKIPLQRKIRLTSDIFLFTNHRHPTSSTYQKRRQSRKMAAGPKPSKNQLRRAKKKAEKVEKQKVRLAVLLCFFANFVQVSESPAPETTIKSEEDTDIKIEVQKHESSMVNPEPLVVDEIDFDNMTEDDPLFEMYKDVMEKFQQADKEDPATKEAEKPEIMWDEDDDIPDEAEEKAEPKLSKKKRKQLTQLSVAELKALVKKPEIVEGSDVSSSDPRLLVHIKSYRNVVPVPDHWSLKREYLSSKRGIEKPAFSLPKFIQDTGIAEMRDAVLEKQENASLKQKQRERVQPKMGKLDIDYQKLYEAFFRFQTKPELTRYGEVYYEGKEYETNHKHLRPGELSDELKEALSIPPGAPPPWLINQQRFGPPPSYPALKIPGLNAPPPAGGSWGFHPGGYGKPPVDEYNRPLYGGDVFGVLQVQQNTQLGEPVEKNLWGELQAPEEESEEEEEEEEEEEDQEDDGAGTQTPSGLETPGGMASAVPTEFGGAESMAGEFDLRKQRRGTETEESPHPRSAYQVLPEQQIKSSGFFGGNKAYDLSGTQNQNLPVLGQDDNGRKRKKPGDVDVAMDPDTLQAKDGVDKEDLKRMYEAQKQQEKGSWDYEDLTDMIAEESRKRQKRDEERKARRG
jgi:splicing factor 3B subunit 2